MVVGRPLVSLGEGWRSLGRVGCWGLRIGWRGFGLLRKEWSGLAGLGPFTGIGGFLVLGVLLRGGSIPYWKVHFLGVPFPGYPGKAGPAGTGTGLLNHQVGVSC